MRMQGIQNKNSRALGVRELQSCKEGSRYLRQTLIPRLHLARGRLPVRGFSVSVIAMGKKAQEKKENLLASNFQF